MKRSADGAVRRQTPVSCVLCRTKKLKCDRTQPCSNCKARNIACSFIDGSRGTAGSPPAALRPELNLQTLDARLKRVEELLGTRSASTSGLSNELLSDEGDSAGTFIRVEEDELSRTADLLESDTMDNKPSHLKKNGHAPIHPLAKTFQATCLPFPMFTSPTMDINQVVKTLPTHNQAKALFDFYVAKVNWLYHIIHVPTVRKYLDEVYEALNRARMPPCNNLALITTILALAAYFSPGPVGGISRDELHGTCFQSWSSFSQECLVASNYVANPTIVSLQAMILLSHHLLPNLGATATFSTIRATSISIAHGLALHRVDTPENKEKRKTQEYDLVTLEVKRRVWWHIASSDWLLTYMSGAQAGTYMVHPQQMETDMPGNADDESLSSVQPESVPTQMTYFIFRARMSEIFRRLVDAATIMKTEVEKLPYSTVLEFDQYLHDIFNHVPTCFKMDPESQAKSKAIVAARPYLATQRDMGQVGMHTRLCRLHRPWLSRGTHDPRFAYSRTVCLNSSRTVIAMATDIMKDFSGIDPQRVWTITHHLFVATIILVMDFCFTVDEPRKKEKREEIMECFRLLEKSEKESTIARTGLEQLRGILKKWKNGAAPENTEQGRKDANNSAEGSADAVGFLWERGEVEMGKPRAAPEVAVMDMSRVYAQPAAQPANQVVQTDFNDPWAGIQDMYDPYNYWMETFNFDVDLSGNDWDALLRQVDSYDTLS